MLAENNNKTEMDETAKQRLQQAASNDVYKYTNTSDSMIVIVCMSVVRLM